jgi:hypothetical protein
MDPGSMNVIIRSSFKKIIFQFEVFDLQYMYTLTCTVYNCSMCPGRGELSIINAVLWDAGLILLVDSAGAINNTCF